MVPQPSVNGRVSTDTTAPLPAGFFVLNFEDFDFDDEDLGMQLVEARRVCEAFAEVWHECRVVAQMPGVETYYYALKADQ